MEEELKEYHFIITEDGEGERIDKYLNVLMESMSRSYIQKLLTESHVTVNGKVIKANYRLKQEDNICLLLPPAVTPDISPENIPLCILYEDDDVIVINKPKGMVVHPAPGHYSGTLVNALLYHCRENLSGINGVLRPGIVHRIDMNTTGSLIVCKNDTAHSAIAKQLKEHTIVRKYRAIVFGNMKEDEGTIHTLIGRHPIDRKKMAVVSEGGREAITHYHVLERFGNFTYVECFLETGRTHQIRVHMAHIGHPLLGDDVYASGHKHSFKTNGQTLHAMILGFIHPVTNEYVETTAPLPDYFSKILDTLNNK